MMMMDFVPSFQSAKDFLGFETHFLKDQLLVILDDPVRAFKCKNGNIGITQMSAHDQDRLDNYMDMMCRTFPFGIGMVKRTWNRETVFFNGKNVSYYDKQKERLNEWPARGAHCRVAITVKGLKVDKERNVSFIWDICQLKLADIITFDACVL